MRYLMMFLVMPMVVCGSLQQAEAKCASHSVTFTPKRGTKAVPRNVMPFLALYGSARLVLPYLKGAHLVSKGHRVPLKVRQQSGEGYRMFYITLAPTQKLKPHRRYRLELNTTYNPSKDTLLKPWHRQTLSYSMGKKGSLRTPLTRYFFHTSGSIDRSAPRRPKRITSKGYKYARMGCGPSKLIPMRLYGLSDNRTPKRDLRYVIEATVVNKKGASKRFIVYTGVSWRAGRTHLGHGMCSGNFAKMEPGKYTIRVRAIDFAGHHSPASPAITVTVP